MSNFKKGIKNFFLVFTAFSFIVGGFFVGVANAATTINISNLQPSWTATYGGEVYSAYVGPSAYDYVSPGITAIYDGREAGIIKAGLTVDSGSGVFEDEGLFGFKPTVTIDVFANGILTYDVENQAGVNPVWMTIEIDTGVIDNRADNTTYQFVPTTNPSGWNTFDAGAGLWQKWNNNNGDVTGNDPISLSAVAATHPGLNVVRAYLRLGMGNSYNNGGTGTIAWVDKVTLGGVTYDFVVAPHAWSVNSSLSDDSQCNALAFQCKTIQAAINAAVAGDTINVAAGTYTTTGQVVIDKNLSIIGIGEKPTISPNADLPTTNNVNGAWFLVNSNITLNLNNLILDGNGFKVYQGVRSHGTTTIENVDFKNILNPSTPNVGFAIANFGGTVPGGAGSDSHSLGGLAANLTVTNSSFFNIGRIGVLIKGTESTATVSGNTYTGKGDVVALDYAIEFGAGGSGTATNNTISNNRGVASDGSTSAGILVTDYYGTGTSATIEGNTIINNTDGIAIGYDENDASVVVVHNNNLSGNVVSGISSTNPSVDATNNWWGTAVPEEVALRVVGNVDFSPWYSDEGMTKLSYPVATTPPIIMGDLTVDVPDNITITGDSSWSGVLDAITTAIVNLDISGFTTDIGLAVAVGSSTSDLTFDKAVKLTFAGQASTHVGWYNHANVFTEIMDTCTANDQATGDLLPAGADCKIDVAPDLVVWTKHFSTFVTYTQTPVPVVTTPSGSGGGRPPVLPPTPVVAVIPATVGQVLGVATITGCDNRTIGFSVTTGQSCIGNTGTTSASGQVLGAEKFNFTRFMRNGTRGNEVTEFQTFLNTAGYNCGTVDGKFGPKTRAAVVKFQLANGLVGDGVVGPLTRAVLNK
jgi:hypothetical protein